MMVESNPNQAEQKFAAQFTAEGSAFIYRKNQTGAPIPVSQSERDTFVATFDRRMRYFGWSILPGVLAVTALTLILTLELRHSPSAIYSHLAAYSPIAVYLVICFAIRNWFWNAPARELEHRTPVGSPLTREEAKKLTYSKVSISGLAASAIMAVLITLKVSLRTDVLHGWGRLQLVAAALIIATAGFGVFQKWRVDQRRSGDPD